MILEIILFCIFSYTLASIIVEQKIFEEGRAWLKQCSTGHPNFLQKKICQLVSCMFCSGFWSGIFVSLGLGFTPLVGLTFGFALLGGTMSLYILHGFLGASSSYTIHLLMGLLIRKAESLGIDT